ncbi:MAG: PAS domain-containing protein [Desulfobacterales bacterium]|jgi:two-component system sensor histidine kinase UhpB|nr:PAS domain-containing protein [Desulfobacterales bacterium]
MINEKIYPGQKTDLRSRAERACREKFAQRPAIPETLTPEVARKMIHELKVYQEELEIQNEELRQAYEELDILRARYFDLYELAPAGYFTLSEKGMVLEANLTAATQLGLARSDLIHQPITRWIFNEDQPIYYRHHKLLFETGKGRSFELRMVKTNAGEFWAHIEAMLSEHTDGASVCHVIISDISDTKRIESRLNERVKELRGLYDISTLLGNPALSFDEKLIQTVRLIPTTFQLPEIAAARIETAGKTYQTPLFKETQWMTACDIHAFGKPVGRVTLCYIKKQAFLPEEKRFIRAIAERISHAVENKQLMASLRKSEDRFRQAVNATKDGIWEWDIQTGLEYFSPRWCKIVGYSADDPELVHTYEGWASRIHPDDVARVRAALQNHLEQGTPYDVEYRHLHKSGEYRWQNSIGQAIFDEKGTPCRMVGCIRDITARKLAEEKLHFLSTQLLVSKEKEQHRIAMELHDQTGQDLMVLKLRLEAIKNRMRKDQPKLKREVEETLVFVDEIVEDIRRLVYGLSPDQLQSLGLSAAVSAMIRNYSQKTGIPVDLDVTALNVAFAPEKEIVLYRIFQEALTNIYKHAHARKIRIDIYRQKDALFLKIKDDGTGFNLGSYQKSTAGGERGMGLAAMELRARMIAADLKIVSGPGEGTEISLLVPINGKGAVS